MKLLLYILSMFRAVFLIAGMIVWMIFYFFTLIFVRHSKERALELRHTYLKYFAVPLLGLKIEKEGNPADQIVMYVANHRSFADPIVICRYLKAFVVAKAEVASYPIINYGAQLTGVLYVKRDDKNSRNTVRRMIIETIKSGYNILVFPEGTVGLKRGTLEFKSGAFAEAVKNKIPIVPIAIEYKSEADLWLIPNFVKQFLNMFAKISTHVKVSFGPKIITEDVDVAYTEAHGWIQHKMFQMQEGWSEINFDKYNNG